MKWFFGIMAALTLGVMLMCLLLAVRDANNVYDERNRFAKECEQHGGSLIATGNGYKCFKFERIKLDNERDQ